jgi:hypothetical protein
MSAQIVFLSLFLGLTAGMQPIALHVEGPVNTIRIDVAGRPAATMTQPPWRAMVDLGQGLTPREIVAHGYDGQGNEIAQASQVINLPRDVAEFEIVLHSEAKQVPSFIELRWRHLTNVRPKRAAVAVDGKPLSVDTRFQARLPPLDSLVPHVISAELRFEDGFVARRELVIEGLRSDSIGTQLTPVLMTEIGPPPASTDGCFSVDGIAVRAAGMEKPNPLVVIVQDLDTEAAAEILGRTGSVRQRLQIGLPSLERGTSQRVQWPITRHFIAADQVTAVLFEWANDVDASKRSMLWMLTRSYYDRSRFGEPRQFADAVAVAALNAIKGGRRRAVVLVLGSNQEDTSRYDPTTVRRYLTSVGVPLFVWSVTSPPPEVVASWGDVEDVSSVEKLQAATGQLRRNLDAQRVVWVAADPLAALRVEVKPECGLTPMARLTP